MKQVALSYLRKCFSFVLNASSSRSLWLFPDIVFYLTTMGREFRKNCKYVHTVAEEVINARRKTLVGIDIFNIMSFPFSLLEHHTILICMEI
jgi:hypothetical protein